MTTDAPVLRADLEAGLRRLKLSTFRPLAPELVLSAKTQRWAPEDLLGALVEAEVAARDASMAAARLKAACFPIKKSLEDFDLSASSVPRATLDYLASLEWVRAKEWPCFVGPPGTGKSHCLVALGHAAVEAGYKVRYFVATELVDSLYRGLADNSVGKVIESLLRADVVICDLCQPRVYADMAGAISPKTLWQGGLLGRGRDRAVGIVTALPGRRARSRRVCSVRARRWQALSAPTRAP